MKINKEQRERLEAAKLEAMRARLEVFRVLVNQENLVSADWAREHILGQGKLLLS